MQQQRPLMAVAKDQDQLTLPGNWGQIAPGRRFFAFFAGLALFLEIEIMCCSSWPARARRTGAGGRVAQVVALVFVLAIAVASSAAQAQSTTPTPAASPTPTSIDSDRSAGIAVTNRGSNFLERLRNQASNGFRKATASNPVGGGASESADPP